MSNLDQHGNAAQSSAGPTGSGLAAALAQKKKRHHGNASGAIAARRAGHLGVGLANDEEDVQGAPFISSSRDASEVRYNER
jgi:hypothetical protein